MSTPVVSKKRRRADGSGLVRFVDVSFVIPALNEERWIGDCLDSIGSLALPATIGSIQIVVVDNQSRDRTASIAQAKGAVVVSCPPGNAARARNAGASATTGEWLAFVDADCCLDADWLLQSAKLMAAADTVATGSRIIPPDTAQNWVARTLGEMAGLDGSVEPNRVSWLPTAGLIVKREHFQSIAGFDESLVTCEDCDLGYRLSERGDLLFNPAARLIHHGESKSLGEVFWREAWRTRGNFRLAFGRPSDIKNWISLLLPVVFVLLMVTGLVGIALAFVCNFSMLLPSIMLFLGCLIPTALVGRSTQKSSGKLTVIGLVRRCAVISTFLAGRAIGLVWRFPRVER